MVKCKTRRRRNALQEFCLAKEAEEEAKREARRKKNEEKRQQQIIESSGADGKVAALDSVRFSGTFGVSFSREPERTMTKAELRVARMNGDLMLPEVNDSEQNGPLAKQSAKKQAGFELGRRNYLIKKAKKMEKQKEKREMKSGKKQVIKLKKKSDKMKD